MFNYRHARTVLGRPSRVRNAATTTTDYQDIVSIVQLSASIGLFCPY